MVCIYCGGKTDVNNSRPQKRLNRVWRRRHCQVCNAIFTSIEAAELPQSLLVSQEAQNTGNAPLVTSFRRDKLYVSIYNSCRHRPDAITDATALTDTILGQLSAHIVNASITSAQLRTLVHTALRHFDTAAATHYAAFHPEPPKAP